MSKKVINSEKLHGFEEVRSYPVAQPPNSIFVFCLQFIRLLNLKAYPQQLICSIPLDEYE